MAHYVVTGGCGFIGSHVVDSLIADGQSVVVLDNLSTGRRSNLNPKADLVVGSVTDGKAVEAVMTGARGCIHLAAVSSVQDSIQQWPETHRINQTGSVLVFDAARRLGSPSPIPVVFASSAAVYGNAPRIPCSEDALPAPLSPYGADKLGSELHGRAGSAVHASRISALRLFNIYGPRQNPDSPYSGVISVFADRLRRNAPLTIFGDGEQVRDFVYVLDAVAALRAALARLEASAAPQFGLYNVCRGEGVSINRLADLLAEILGTSVDVGHEPERPGDIRASVGDPSRLKAELGMVPATALEDGLRMTLAGG